MNSGMIRRLGFKATAAAAAAVFPATILLCDDELDREMTELNNRPDSPRRCTKNMSGRGVKSTSNTDQLMDNSASALSAKMLFLGTGSSTGCPKPLCSLIFPEDVAHDENGAGDGVGQVADSELRALRDRMSISCRTSRLASKGDPRDNRNYRNNPSLLISHRNNDDSDDDNLKASRADSLDPLKTVVIDVGKTFREGAIRWMPTNGVQSVDAIVLTHEHADAVLGLDDLRGFQRGPMVWNGDGPSPRVPIPVFLSDICFDRIKVMFDYLVPKDPNNATGLAEGGKKVVRAVASLSYHVIEPFKPFVAAGLRMIPLPVMHGEDLICLGFAFTVNGQDNSAVNVVYLSDISRMPAETEDYILRSLPPTDVLVIDSLLVHGTHPVHFSLDQALHLARKLKPHQTYIIGMNCDDFLPHSEMNKQLSQLELNVQLAHDGLVISV